VVLSNGTPSNKSGSIKERIQTTMPQTAQWRVPISFDRSGHALIRQLANGRGTINNTPHKLTAGLRTGNPWISTASVCPRAMRRQRSHLPQAPHLKLQSYLLAYLLYLKQQPMYDFIKHNTQHQGTIQH